MSRTTFALKAVNVALTPFTRRQPAPALAKAVRAAERDAGATTDEQDQTWIEEFGFLLECIARAPEVSPVGWAGAVLDTRNRLANRLRIRRIQRDRPEVLDEPIERPIFIVGLPRTATTLAHRILAASAGHRGPCLWEMHYTDLAQSPEVERKRRKRTAKQYDAVKFAPDFAVVHPLDSDKPEESMFLLPQGIFRVVSSAPMHDYLAWWRERDPVEDYRYLKQALQVLQHEREPRRWILKHPMDLGEMETIKRVFPDATFVWTHRSPLTVLGSMCSLADLSMSITMRRVDREALGPFVLELLADQVERGRTFRQNNLGAVVDVPYHRLVSDPHRFVPDLYDQLGATWTEQDAGRLGDLLAKPIRDRKHEYQLAAYGLGPDQVEKAFGDYEQYVSAVNNR